LVVADAAPAVTQVFELTGLVFTAGQRTKVRAGRRRRVELERFSTRIPSIPIAQRRRDLPATFGSDEYYVVTP
jgi:hypothetical protein